MAHGRSHDVSISLQYSQGLRPLRQINHPLSHIIPIAVAPSLRRTLRWHARTTRPKAHSRERRVSFCSNLTGKVHRALASVHVARSRWIHLRDSISPPMGPASLRRHSRDAALGILPRAVIPATTGLRSTTSCSFLPQAERRSELDSAAHALYCFPRATNRLPSAHGAPFSSAMVTFAFCGPCSQ